MAIERKIHRGLARSRAALDVTERRRVRERGGDIYCLESLQMRALQEFLVLWPEDEKVLFIKIYVEEVLLLENRYLYPPGNTGYISRTGSLMRWLVGGAVLFLAMFLLSSRK